MVGTRPVSFRNAHLHRVTCIVVSKDSRTFLGQSGKTVTKTRIKSNDLRIVMSYIRLEWSFSLPFQGCSFPEVRARALLLLSSTALIYIFHDIHVANKECAISHSLLNEGIGIREYSTFSQLNTFLLHIRTLKKPISSLPNEDFGRRNKRWNQDFRSTFQGCETSIWATNHWKVLRKSWFHLLFLLPKSSFESIHFFQKIRAIYNVIAIYFSLFGLYNFHKINIS